MSPRPNSFTLIELLIVVGVVAILSVAVVMALNPTQLMAQGRDATRLNDLDTLNHALVLYGAERSAFGSPNTIYVSVPDPTIVTTNGTSSCSGLGLNTATLPTGWTYQCASTSSVQDVDGTGWLPVNFTQITSKPLSQLPIDPVNTTSSGNYYTYVTNGSQWELTSLAESQKYKSQTNSKTPFQPGLLAQGSNLALSPLFNSQGLVGYWNFDEGSGTIAYDQSGNGNNGSFAGTPTWQSNCKSGNCLDFNATGYNAIQVLNSSSLNISNNLTVMAWIKLNGVNGSGGSFHPMSLWNGTTSSNYVWYFCGLSCGSNNTFMWYANAGGTWQGISRASISIPSGTWIHVALVYSNSGQLYWNGLPSGSSTAVLGNLAASTNILMIGSDGGGSGDVLMDDVRIYNRALSASEIQAIYSATK